MPSELAEEPTGELPEEAGNRAPSGSPSDLPAVTAREPEPNVADVALVFEGGGMRAACTAGMVVSLLKANLNFPFVAGISAGSSHLANYVSRDPVRARRSFVEFARDPNLGNLRTWLRGDGLFNADYIYQHTSEPGEFLPYRWQAFVNNPVNFRVGAFCAGTGKMVYWGREDVACKRDFLVRVQASSTMPVFMPPVEVAGDVFVDGALGPSGGIPLDAAKAAGFKRFLVVSTRPRDYVKGEFRGSRVTDRLFRDFPAVTEALRQRPDNYNATREELLDLEAQGDAYFYTPKGALVSNQERRISRLWASFVDGLTQVASELPAIRRFLFG